VVLKIGYSVKWSRNKLKVVKCGAGERWRKTIRPIELEIKEDSRRRGTSYVK
jgi:hypothetical protein